MTTSNSPAWGAHAGAIAGAEQNDQIVPARSWNQLRRSMALLAVLCIALIGAADFLFYRQAFGWTPAIFGVLLLLAISVRSARYLQSWPGRIIAIGFIGLCMALVEHPSTLRITLAILALMSLAMISARGWTTSVPAWVVLWSEFIARCTFQLPVDSRFGNRWRANHGRGSPPWHRIIINWTVPLGLSLVFVLIFAVANPIISKWVGQASDSIGTFFSNFGEFVSIGRLLLWLVVGFIAWMLLRGRTRWRGEALETMIFAPPKLTDRLPATDWIVRCLILFNIVFAVQLALDLTTVLNNGSNLPDGMSFREYARRGAYPLVFTALMAATFVLATFRTGLSDAALQRMRWARRLVYFWIAQNIVLMLTAAFRLRMYVDAFGLTHLRIAAAVWMLLVAMGLIWIIWRIVGHRTNSWLLRINVLTMFIVLYGCCFFNFDSMIAKYDIRRVAEVGGNGPRADLKYLAGLGPEAIPTLHWLSDHAQDNVTRIRAATMADELRRDLNNDLETWQGWTMRRARLAAREQ